MNAKVNPDYNRYKAFIHTYMQSSAFGQTFRPADSEILRNSSTFKVDNTNNNMNMNANSTFGPVQTPNIKSFSNTSDHNLYGANNNAQKEVDYYHNPTELFRWINYRRWDGARSRVITNPDEASVWVVSRHSTDSRVLWRQLPLHLVCMQSCIDASCLDDENRDSSESGSRGSAHSSADEATIQRQIEDLVEELLEAYPEGAYMQDDQGMLPLHSCLNAINASSYPNEKVLYLLVTANAGALRASDRYGRKPMDILREKDVHHPVIQKAIRLLMRVQGMEDSLKDLMKSDVLQLLQEAEKKAENERLASQRIIKRLEQELAEELAKAEKESNSAGKVHEISNVLREELKIVKKDYSSVERDLEQTRKERDGLIAKIESMQDTIDKQARQVDEMKKSSSVQKGENEKTLASIKSEANAAKAMAKGMESQLRTKFVHAEELKSTVSHVKKEMATLTSQSKREKKKLLDDIERLEDELQNVKSFSLEMEKKNETLREQNRDLDNHLSEMIMLYNSLSSQYDKMYDEANRHESTMIEKLRRDRSKLATSIEKQRKIMQDYIVEQEKILAQSSKEELSITEGLTYDKKNRTNAVDKIKEDFLAIRSKLSAKYFIAVDVLEDDQSQSVCRYSPTEKKNERSSEERIPLSSIKSPSVPMDTSFKGNRKEEGERSLDLLNFLEGNAQYHRRKYVPNKEKDQIFQSPSMPVSRSKYTNSSAKRNSVLDSDEGYEKKLESRKCNRSSHFSPIQMRKIKSDIYDPRNSKENFHLSQPKSRNRGKPLHDENESATVIDRYSTESQHSFSLDEFSDMDSRTSVEYSRFPRGMRNAMQRDLIRVRSVDSTGGH